MLEDLKEDTPEMLSSDFLKAFMEDLHRQALTRILPCAAPFDFHFHTPNELDGMDDLSSALLNSKLNRIFLYLSKQAFLQFCRGQSAETDFQEVQSALLTVYSKVFKADDRLIQPTLIRGMIEAIDEMHVLTSRESELAIPSEGKGNCSIIPLPHIAKNSVVYFVQNPSSRKIKIGYSTNFEQRLKSLQCGAGEKLDVLLLINAGRDFEALLHSRFSKHRCSGEWFSQSDDILSFISAHANKEAI